MDKEDVVHIYTYIVEYYSEQRRLVYCSPQGCKELDMTE